MHRQALLYIESLKSGQLIMLIANCSTVVMCLLSELMCFLLLRHKAACLRVLCEIAAPEGKRTSPSSILPIPLPLDREEDKYCCRCLTLPKWDFSSQIYQALTGCLRLQNLALGMIKWQHMFLNHPPPCYCQRVMMIPSTFFLSLFLCILLCIIAIIAFLLCMLVTCKFEKIIMTNLFKKKVTFTLLTCYYISASWHVLIKRFLRKTKIICLSVLFPILITLYV